MAPKQETVEIAGRTLRLSNLEKPLWPAHPPDSSAFTKGQMIDYYTRIAPVMIPHLAGRAITLRRWPDGVESHSFFEKNCPSHRPDWLATVAMGDVDYCRVEEPAALAWTANLASVELHPTLARLPDLEAPTAVVFDLDPGEPADILTCATVALLIRDVLDRFELTGFIKSSGSKGLQLYVPVGPHVGYERTRTFAHVVARLLERSHPDLVVTTQERAVRKGKVLIDWGQNAPSKTTVCVYSMRPWAQPSVSTPLHWEEVEAAEKTGDRDRLRFGPDEVLARVEREGDLLAGVLAGEGDLPDLGDNEVGKGRR
ncbi:MAG: non-homologous end-joining DNA ligase [Acidimicrobiaceae bacterium]|nr:non-homologous end-joining DNA ligase [Acidimicrobiaceae bacterium]